MLLVKSVHIIKVLQKRTASNLYNWVTDLSSLIKLCCLYDHWEGNKLISHWTLMFIFSLSLWLFYIVPTDSKDTTEATTLILVSLPFNGQSTAPLFLYSLTIAGRKTNSTQLGFFSNLTWEVFQIVKLSNFPSSSLFWQKNNTWY